MLGARSPDGSPALDGCGDEQLPQHEGSRPKVASHHSPGALLRRFNNSSQLGQTARVDHLGAALSIMGKLFAALSVERREVLSETEQPALVNLMAGVSYTYLVKCPPPPPPRI